MSVQVLADELASTIAAVQANLGQPDATTHVTFAADTRFVEGYQVAATVRQFEFASDEPASIGGTDTGPTPVEFVLAGLASCQEIVYATYARVFGIPLEGVSVHAEGLLDLRGFYGVADVPVGFERVTYLVDIASPAPAEDVARLIAAVDAHCPVLEIVRSPIPVTSTYLHNGAAIFPA
jgi:putative redox protein